MSEVTGARLPIWLIVSLIVNALLIGLLIGGGLGKKTAPTAGPSGSERAFMRSIDSVASDAERAEIRAAFRRAYGESREQRRLVRDARRDLAEILASEPYDEVKVAEAFARLRAADDAAKSVLHDALSKQLGKLDSDQRRAVLRTLDRPGGRRGPRGEDRGDRRPPPPPRD